MQVHRSTAGLRHGPRRFYVSLALRDIAASRAFCEKLGFSVFGGDPSQR
jgi:hypothetical protein